MPLSKKQRSTVNRANAAKSTGPKTAEGKAKSSQNAVQHGCRSKVHALPTENPAEIQARSDAWNDYYKPQSPGAQQLVNECVHATILSDRCQQFHAAALAKQVRDTIDQNAGRLRILTGQLEENPSDTVEQLSTFSDGRKWMIQRWVALYEALLDLGGWTKGQTEQAVQLMGFYPDLMALDVCPIGWKTRFFALLCEDEPDLKTIETMLHPSCCPPEFRKTFTIETIPDASVCLKWLTRETTTRLNALYTLDAALSNPNEALDMAEAPSRALILQDPAQARLFLRYHSEARTSFHRAYSALLKTIELDADSSQTVEEAPEPVPVEAPKEVSPNEPNCDVTPTDPESSDLLATLTKALSGEGLSVWTLPAAEDQGADAAIGQKNAGLEAVCDR